MRLPRVLILGAGFGGLSAAHTLKSRSNGAIDLLVIDRAHTFMMGLRKLWLLDGRTMRGMGTRPRPHLPRAGIPFRHATVEAIDVERRRVRVGGEEEPYDFLIVALGAEPRADLVPGAAEMMVPASLAGGGEQRTEPEAGDAEEGTETDPRARSVVANIYTIEGVEAAAKKLGETSAGRVAIVIAGVPYKCPPAPYEAAFLVDDLLRRTGRRDSVELGVTTPQPMSIPAAGPVVCASVEGRLLERGIAFRPKAEVESMGPGTVSYANGDTIEADLVMFVPPHRPPRVVKASGLAGEGEWIRVDPSTLRTDDERVFAIGDSVEMTTGAGLPFPKAGVFAERHGEVVGANIAAMVGGGEPNERFEGEGFCFLEVGGGAASKVGGNFLANPPDVTVSESAPEHLEAKKAFERERLDRWIPLGEPIPAPPA